MVNKGFMNSISGKLLAIIAACVVVFAVVMVAYLTYFRAQLVQDRSATLAKSLQAQVDTQISGKLDILVTNAITISHNAKVREALQKNEYSLAIGELNQIIEELDRKSVV